MNRTNNKTFKNSEFWNKLLQQQQLITKKSISTMFELEPNRFKDYSIKIQELGLLFDFSKQHIDYSILNILYQAAQALQLSDRIKDLYSGNAKINCTENRTVGHTLLRLPKKSLMLGQELSKMLDFADKLYSSNATDILYLGIGGSYLGPKMVCEALDEYTVVSAKNIRFHFVANHDIDTLEKIVTKLIPENTILIISSKSFNTLETLKNADFFRNWLKDKSLNDKYLSKVFAITSNFAKARQYGVLLDNIFKFEENIGGRYSVWSSVGLPILIKLGITNFNKFLKGAYLIDQHFCNAPFKENIPVNLGLLSVWNINFMQYPALAVIPYVDSLSTFPEYLQQLSMESNGKSVDTNNQKLDYATGEIIFGGVGSNVQHSFMQLLHQGTRIIPVDFIVTAKQEFLLANCLAQSQALMQGTNNVDSNQDISANNHASFKFCAGNRPSNTFLLAKLTPEALGALVAIYEHKIFVQSVMWNINPFDQWGVELGKVLANDVLEKLQLSSKNVFTANNQDIDRMLGKDLVDSSTLGLIQEYINFNTNL